MTYTQEPTWNMKCIILTLILALAYWFLPNHNYIAFASIFIFFFISTFIYDKLYVCQSNVFRALIIALTFSLFYWFLPPKNKWILLLILFITYLFLAYYDYYFKCERNMGPTYLSLFYYWLKPQDSQQIQDYKNWDPKIKRKVLIVDIIIVIMVIAAFPFFIKWNP